MNSYFLAGLMALILSSFAEAREMIEPEFEVKVYEKYLIKLGEHPGCGFDYLSFADRLCVKGEKECIKNDFPAFMYQQKDEERFLKINEAEKTVSLLHLGQLHEIGKLQLIEANDEVVYEYKSEKCKVINPSKRYKLILNDDVSKLKVTKDSFTKRVVNSGAVRKHKYIFETLELKFDLGNDRIKILAIDGDPADWGIPATRNYTIEENKFNGDEDYPDYSYFNYFFNRHRR